MSNHMQLTPQERLEAAAYWGNYFRSGGVSVEEPTAFQLDAVNDPTLRDALFFWQVGGYPQQGSPWMSLDAVDHPELMHFPETYTAFGEQPTPDAVLAGINEVFKFLNGHDENYQDLDTGTVFILMHTVWLCIGGDYQESVKELSKVTYLHTINGLVRGERTPHQDPLSGWGTLSATLSMRLRDGKTTYEEASALSRDVVGVNEDSHAAQWAWDTMPKTHILAESASNQERN